MWVWYPSTVGPLEECGEKEAEKQAVLLEVVFNHGALTVLHPNLYNTCNRQQPQKVEVQRPGELTRWSRYSGCKKSAAWRTWRWTCGSLFRKRFFASAHLCERNDWLRPRWTIRSNLHRPYQHRINTKEINETASSSLSSAVWTQTNRLPTQAPYRLRVWGAVAPVDTAGLLRWQLSSTVHSTRVWKKKILHPDFPSK